MVCNIYVANWKTLNLTVRLDYVSLCETNFKKSRNMDCSFLAQEHGLMQEQWYFIFLWASGRGILSNTVWWCLNLLTPSVSSVTNEEAVCLVLRNLSSGVTQNSLSLLLCHFLALRPALSYLASLCLSFSIYKIGIVIISTSGNYVRIKQDDTIKTCDTEPGIKEVLKKLKLSVLTKVSGGVQPICASQEPL